MEEKRVISGDVNPWTNQKYSQKYYDILVKRKELPVFEQRDDFLNNLRNNQVIVLQGETGSGKTTQACHRLNLMF
jgi:pre-mRNA-splicing factor ATP-dependent RNA helicase DHX15/PRP43